MTQVRIPYDLWLYIAEFVIPPYYNIRPWVRVDKLNKDGLSAHTKATDFLLTHLNFISVSICYNPHPKAALLLRTNFRSLTLSSRTNVQLIDWQELHNNPGTWAQRIIDTYGRIYDNVCRGTPLKITHNEKILVCIPYASDEEAKTSNLIHYIKLDIEIAFSYYNNQYNWDMLSETCDCEHIAKLLRFNISKINWIELSNNPSPYAIDILKDYLEYINWLSLSSNSSSQAIDILSQNIDKISWINLCCNSCPQAIELVSQHLDKLDRDALEHLSLNSCPQAIEILKCNPHLICWDDITRNSSAMHLIQDKLRSDEPHKVNIEALLFNGAPEAYKMVLEHLDELQDIYISDCVNHPKVSEYLKLHPEKICSYTLSSNPSPKAMELLNLYPEHINWDGLCTNPCPQAMKLLEVGIQANTVNWNKLLLNSEATDLILKYTHKITDWSCISDAYFELDAIKSEYQYERYLYSFNIKH